ncbi:MBL fold metallo-hydrolase [Candidatus Bathyarchaeota archaeon]|nr:MBL fold metallo-hydrolase [Candidatus Bathyarchaeota archaeon]MBS7631124.1 MBL fold metallo-hydrolase [Candidatus Bathyarchaeota archaeon]
MNPKDQQDIVRPAKWWEALPRPVYSKLKKVESSQPWFEVYKIEPEVYVFYEPGQFEEAISYLVLGEEKAALIDTGCGIGNIKRLAEEFTELPVMVVNTHSHNDHIAQNYLFKEVAIFDAPNSREAARRGCTKEEMAHLIAPELVWKPFPKEFDPKNYFVPPFKVTRWLKEGDVIDLGGRELEVFHTPGHSPDSICLLDADAKLFWTGDMFYTGAIYTYLPGGDIDTFIKSYRKMLEISGRFDKLMPSHNEPWIEKEVLKNVLKAVEEIKEGKGRYVEGVEGGIKIRRYNYDRFSIITKA